MPYKLINKLLTEIICCLFRIVLYLRCKNIYFMKKGLVISVLLLLTIFSVFYIRNRMILSEKIEKLNLAIDRQQGLTELLLKIPNASMSFGDVFKRCDLATNQNDSIFLNIKLYGLDDALNDSIKDYLTTSNDLISNLKFCNREMMEANDLVESTLTDFGSLYINYYSNYFLRNIIVKRVNYERYHDKFIEHRNKFIQNYKILLRKENTLKGMMSKSGIKFNNLYLKYKDINLTELEVLSKDDSNYTKYYNLGMPYITDLVRYNNLEKCESQSDTGSIALFRNYKYKLVQFTEAGLLEEVHGRKVIIKSIKANNIGNVEFIYNVYDKYGAIIPNNNDGRDNTFYMNKNKETGDYEFTIVQN